jgi:hypothetical protein
VREPDGSVCHAACLRARRASPPRGLRTTLCGSGVRVLSEDFRAALRYLNESEINWSKAEPFNCTRCDALPQWPPSDGSYASMLADFEAAIGASLPGPRSRVRLLVLFLEPRSNERHFTAVPSDVSPHGLVPPQHRYFCLTQAAWESLNLETATGSRIPLWPTEQTAPEYARRYLLGGGWSYDGFLAYLMFRLRPEDAYVTNLAKCFLGKASDSYRTCAAAHLARGIDLFAPNLVVSFTSLIQSASDLKRYCGPISGPDPAVLYLYHFAAYRKYDKSDGFRRAGTSASPAMRDLGIDPQALVTAWKRDSEAIRGSSG